MLTVGSLFSGIGGMDLGLERAGLKIVWQSEIDIYASRVLQKHWPNVINIGDVTKIDWGKINYVDVIAGGYPCQPFSTAGKRRGTNDHRHLWPYVRNAISAIRPRYALLENVPGHVSLGLPTVLSDISAMGYCAEWQIISAAAFGAPHLRERLFIVAYPDNARGRTPKRNVDKNRPPHSEKREIFTQFELGRHSTNVAYADGRRQQKCDAQIGVVSIVGESSQREFVADTDSEFMGQYGSSSDVANQSRQWHDQRERQKTNDVGQWWEIEPCVGRVANGVSNRVDRLKGLGNAVVPQVAEFMGYLISEHAKQFQ